MNQKKRTLVICSGGLDSVTLAYQTYAEQNLIGLLTFDYGQRHKKEILFAKTAAKNLKVKHHIIDISNIGRLLKSSLIDNDNIIPEGHYAADNMVSTVVPNRNAIMLTIAFGLASSMEADCVGIAVHGGDHFIYPDCRPEFISVFSKMQKFALGENSNIELFAPYLTITKSDIAKLSTKHNVPIHETWSCYKGGKYHCGRCGTCVERLEAIYSSKANDKTKYLDKYFWKTVSKTNN